MKFTVLWKPSAEQELAQIWESANDRRDITMASSLPIGRSQTLNVAIRWLDASANQWRRCG